MKSKIISWLFKFSGVGKLGIIFKVLTWALFVFLLWQLYNGWNFAVDAISSKITHKNAEFIQLQDVKEKQDSTILVLGDAYNKKVLQCDSLELKIEKDSIIKAGLIKDLQALTFTMSKDLKAERSKNEKYVKFNKACFIQQKIKDGIFKKATYQFIEVDCNQIFTTDSENGN